MPMGTKGGGAPTKGKYQFVSNDASDHEQHEQAASFGRKACTPISIALIASLIMISQLQLSFETRYEYEYDLHDLKDGGEGETYSFNLWKGAQELWDGGAPILALIVLAWSGIFPYIKLILIGLVDFRSWSSSTPVSPTWGVLSVLAKWSFLDMWVVAMTVLCVRIDIDQHQMLNSWGMSKKLFLRIWTQAVALPGCFYFATALIFSQFLGHFVIHRALHEAVSSAIGDADKTRLALPLTQRVKTGKALTTATAVMCVMTVVGLLAGLTLPFLHLEYHLNVDIQKKWIINEHIESHIIETYSVFRAIGVMAVPNHIGGENVGMSALVCSFVVLAPLVRSMCCCLLWFVPMREDIQRGVASVISWASVVAAADVFSVTALIMIWQLPKLFSNMEEAAEYMYLQLTPCMGLFVLTLFGFVDTLAAASTYTSLMDVLKAENAERGGGGGALVSKGDSLV